VPSLGKGDRILSFSISENLVSESKLWSLCLKKENMIKIQGSKFKVQDYRLRRNL